jgi:cytochrome c553
MMASMVVGKHRLVAVVVRDKLSPKSRPCFDLGRLIRHLAIGVVLAFGLAGCGDEEEAVAPPDIGAGKSLAEAQCVGCHDLEGRGTAPGIPNLAAQVDGYLLESLYAYKEGKRMHAALRDMTARFGDAEIRDVAGYYASLPPLGVAGGAKTPDVLSPYERGKAMAEGCARCHGDDGNSRTPGIPGLAGQQPIYFVDAMLAYSNGRRSISEMEMLRELGRVDMESLASYYAAQTPTRRAAPGFGNPAAGEPLSARCGGCHGAHGVSNDAVTPSLASQDAQYLVNALKGYRGRTRHHDVMLADNSDEEIQDLAAFYATQESRAAERMPITVQGLVEKCDRCHGPDVENPTMAIPKVGGQDRDYLIRALRAYRDGKRGSSLMHNMSLPYSAAIIEGIASLYASQPAR